MKKIYCLALAALVVSAWSCKKDEEGEQDLPVVGEIKISGDFKPYSHNNGWMEGEQIGVFVTSDGQPQNNLLYKPSAVAVGEDNGYGGTDWTSAGNVVLNPVETAAGFKAGEHKVYAYVPYNADSKSCNEVVIPDLSVQEVNTEDYCPKLQYNFGYASATVSENSVAVTDLGDFKSLFAQVTVPSAQLPDELGTVTKVTSCTITANKPIAYKNGTFDFEKETISGEAVNSISYTGEIGIDDYSSWGMGMTLETLYLMVAVPYETALSYEYTVEVTFDNNKTITATGKPSESMSNENNVNMYGALTFTVK